MFENHNKKFKETNTVKMNESPDGYNLKAYLKETKADEIPVKGFFFSTKGQYGKSVAIVVDKQTYVWLPKRYVEEFESFTDKEIDAVNNGHLAIGNFDTYKAQDGVTVTFDFIEK